jgi:hypothetical protein
MVLSDRSNRLSVKILEKLLEKFEQLPIGEMTVIISIIILFLWTKPILSLDGASL